MRKIFLVTHRWLGLFLGIYLFFLSLSGSAVVFRPQIHRWFPYNPESLVEALPVLVIEWLTLFHDELFLGQSGRIVNGAGGILLILMTMSGLFLWWRGKRTIWVYRSTQGSLWWQFHQLVGLWTALWSLAWGFSAVYFAWPTLFEYFMEFDSHERIISGLVAFHFGRFGGNFFTQTLWVIVGLSPVLAVITGLWLWLRKL